MIIDDTFSLNTIVKMAHEKRFPYKATIELLSACNFDCIHCYLPEHNNMGLSYDKIVDILNQLRKMGTLVILLTGGEIFLRDDIMDIIRTARRMGFSVSLLSNASLLTERIVEELERLHINSFSTTIFSLDKSINDEITTVEDSLDSILKGVEL